MAMSIIGLFDSASTAQQAIADLAREGFDRSRVSTSTSSSDLSRFGMSTQDSDLYDRALQRGGNLVIVNSDGSDSDRIQAILDRNGAVDIDSIAEGLRSDATGGTLQVLREQLNVGKQQVQTGGVRVRSYITEEPVQQDVQLREEHVNVERHPVDQPADPNLIDRFKEGTMEVRESAEVPVVNKEAHVVEEVSVNKTADQRTETVRDTVRQTHVDVEDVGNRTTPFDETYWRSDFDRRFRNSGTWETYRPAYEFGYKSRGQYGSDWNTAESQLRQRWETQSPGSWDRYRDAIRSSYEYDTTNAETGIEGRAYADNDPESRQSDTRGFFEKIADAITGDKVDDKTGRRVD